jgi:hypothetical protein
MTKTEFKKRLVTLTNFGVEFDGTDEGGRLGFTVAGFQVNFQSP